MSKRVADDVDKLVEELIARHPRPGYQTRALVPVHAGPAVEEIGKSSLAKWLPKPGQNLAITGKGAEEYGGSQEFPFLDSPEHAWVIAERDGPFEDGSGPLRRLGLVFALPEGEYKIGVETGSSEVPYAYGRAYLRHYFETGYEGRDPVAGGEAKAAHAKALLKIVDALLAYTR